jgi:uncharacterized membrane protein YbjE (DUF340 family)
MYIIIFYFALAVIGYFIGTRFLNSEALRKKIARIQVISIIFLVLSMGIGMGINEKVIDNLNAIGVYALIITLITMGTSVFAVSVARRIIGLNRYGVFENDRIENDSHENVKDGGDGRIMTRIILLSVIIGMTLGCLNRSFLVEYEYLLSYGITAGLSILLLFVGIDLGVSNTLIGAVKEVGTKVFAFPLAIAIGTLVGGILSSLILPVRINEGLAISAGFAWYSFAPGLIIEKGYVIIGAISFMHNIMREMIAIITIPFVADKIGYIEVLGLGASANMDIALPIVEKSTHSGIAIYSFVSGISVSFLVPILVPIFIA